VLKDLPKKHEAIRWCEMTDLQSKIYRDTIRRSRKTIMEAEPEANLDEPVVPGKGKGAAKKKKPAGKTKEKQYAENSSNVLMDLRKAALHPLLFRTHFHDKTLDAIARLLVKEPEFIKRGSVVHLMKEDMEVMTDSEMQNLCGMYKSTTKFALKDDVFYDSGKVAALIELLREYKEQGRRVLVFSQVGALIPFFSFVLNRAQFTQVLRILEGVLDRQQHKYLLLTGDTAVDLRQSLVDEFTEDESISVFLLSTKAGGMGINLTAASVVIMYVLLYSSSVILQLIMPDQVRSGL
jgi:SWI/SNF-related matrix-associated actin-dependent regulator 1 of chromatin subfamily A